jgi:hypothetical protein
MTQTLYAHTNKRNFLKTNLKKKNSVPQGGQKIPHAEAMGTNDRGISTPKASGGLLHRPENGKRDS